jgi:3-dehydroquinate synthase
MQTMHLNEIAHSIKFELGHRVFFTRGVFGPENRVLLDQLTLSGIVKPIRCLVFLDQGLLERNPFLIGQIRDYFGKYSSELQLASNPVWVPGGEDAKSGLNALGKVVEAIAQNHLCRHSFVITVGGGAVLDAVGLAASLVHRGLRQIRMPTTVLSQSDAGIGIKNGVNWGGQKNFLGSFQVPRAVINDFDLLESLGFDQRRDGTAEAVKVSLIRDREFFEWIEGNTRSILARGADAMETLIRRCASLHLRQIAHGGDPFELGTSRPLDFGHWLAHRLELLSEYRLSHGHAVAVGIAVDSLYSSRLGFLSVDQLERILSCLGELGFSLRVGNRLRLVGEGLIESLLEGISEFQEHLGGKLSLTLLKEIGKPIEVDEIDRYQMRQSIRKVIADSFDF